MKRILLSFLFIFGLAIGTVGYFHFHVRNPMPILSNIPASKPHQHATPGGELIEHVHTYDFSIGSNILNPPTVSEGSAGKKHQIQLNWERIDIDAVREKYQPYSVEEMDIMWSSRYKTEVHSNRRKKLDKAYPPEKWLKRNFSLGQPFVNYSDYRMVLQRRIFMLNRRDLWRGVNPEVRQAMRKSLHLPPEIDTWTEYEDAYLKFWIVASYESLLADKTETVYVYITNDNRFLKFEGKRLKRKDKYDLMMYGMVPDGIHVVYFVVDEERLPPGVIPRYYDVYLKELELVYTNINKIVSDHKEFFTSKSSDNKKPSESEQRYNIQDSFELLHDLHWGEFPEDLQALQDATEKLEKIKLEGEDKMKETD